MIATLDPDTPSSYIDLQHFRIAFYGIDENIYDLEDLKYRLEGTDTVVSYNPLSAIRTWALRNDKLLTPSPIAGDYFIVICTSTNHKWRYVVRDKEYVGQNNGERIGMDYDPFGEILAAERGVYYDVVLNHDEPTPEDPDVEVYSYVYEESVPD